MSQREHHSPPPLARVRPPPELDGAVEVDRGGVGAGLGELTAGADAVFDGDPETAFCEIGTTVAFVATLRVGDGLTLRRNVGRGRVARRAGRFPPDGISAT